jgi:hypothetical protein
MYGEDDLPTEDVLGLNFDTLMSKIDIPDELTINCEIRTDDTGTVVVYNGHVRHVLMFKDHNPKDDESKALLNMIVTRMWSEGFFFRKWADDLWKRTSTISKFYLIPVMRFTTIEAALQMLSS